MGEDKRKYPRADLVFYVRYAPIPDFAIETTAKDISRGGIAFSPEGPLAEKSTIEVFFSLPGVQGEIQATGKVVRAWNDSGKHFAAIEFLTIDQNDELIITEYLEAFFSGGFDKN